MALPLLAGALIPLIAELAPHIARRLGGRDAEEAVERVTGAVAAVTGVQVRTPEDVKALRETLLRDVQIRQEFELAMRGADHAMEAAYLDDRANARARDIALQEKAGGNSRANVMLISAFVGVVSIVALLILTPDVPPEVVGFVIGIGGMLTRNIGSAFDFEFGSSRGSKDKTRQVEQLLHQMPPLIGGIKNG